MRVPRGRRVVRVIGGDLARRRIESPKGTDTRPTTDRVREALFQHLESARLPQGFPGLTVLDLYAGSGTLSIEAISRGADHATLVEQDRAAACVIRRNLQALGLVDRATLVARRLPGALRSIDGPFDLVFMDPPYRLEPLASLATELTRLSKATALLVYEHDTRTTPPQLDGWAPPESRNYGNTSVSFYHREVGR